MKRLEAVSFVNPRRVPQMAGAEEIMATLPKAPDGGARIGLVLNLKGWDRCVAARCDEANVVVCATDGFGIRNQGASTAEQMETLAASQSGPHPKGRRCRSPSPWRSAAPSTGKFPQDRIVEIARQAASLGIKEIALADTIGVADPWTVRRRIEAVRAIAPDARLRLHFHDTRRTGLANAFAGVEAGVDVLDASCGGIGGCPFAPNATGNIATEDLVYMLSRAGFETGLDLDKLIETAHWIGGKLGKAGAVGPLPGRRVSSPAALAGGRHRQRTDGGLKSISGSVGSKPNRCTQGSRTGKTASI